MELLNIFKEAFKNLFEKAFKRYVTFINIFLSLQIPHILDYQSTPIKLYHSNRKILLQILINDFFHQNF